MATPFYLEAPKGDEYQPTFLDKVGNGLSRFWDQTPPEAFFALSRAMLTPGAPFASKLGMGISGLGEAVAANKKKQGLAAAFDQFLPTVPEAQRPIFDMLRQQNPEVLMNGMASQMFAKPPEAPSPVREYEYAVNHDGYKGTFTDWKAANQRAGAPTTNVTIAGEKAFEKGAGEWQATTFGKLAEDGLNARGQLSQINTLGDSLAKTPGGWKTGLQNIALQWGIPIGKNADDVTLANSIIAKLVPTQRAPGTGQMSDADLALFKDSLPKLINQQGGNALIINTMKAMAQFKLDQAKISAAALNGQITRQQALEALMALPDPMEQFKARAQGTTVQAGPRKVMKWNPTTGTVE